MKKLYSFITLMLLVTAFSMTAVAQHYVQVQKDLKSISGQSFYATSILPNSIEDTTQVMYIHIIEVKSGLDNGGVKNGKIFKISKYDPDLKKIQFKDEAGKDRWDCFKNGEVLIKLASVEDYIPYKDIKFILADKDFASKNSKVERKLREQCVYDATNRKLDLTLCEFEYIYNGNKLRDNTQHNVSPDTQIEFLTGKEGIPNILIKVSDFKQSTDNNNEHQEKSWFIRNWYILGLVLLVLCCLIIVSFIMLHNRKQNKKKAHNKYRDETKVSNNESISIPTPKEQKHNVKDNKKKHVHAPDKETEKPSQIETTEVVTSVVDERLYQKLEDVLSRVEANQNTLNKQSMALENIKMLVSDTEDKKQLAQKIQELEEEKKKSKSTLEQRDELSVENASLKNQIKQLQEATQIDGSVQILDCLSFVTFAKKIVSECVEAENVAIKHWSSLTSKDQQILNVFLAKYQMTKCCIDLAKWNGIIATLDLKGYVKNDEYIKYLMPLSNKERIQFLNKRFFEEILRPYVGAIVLFLEQIRTSTKIGVSIACDDNIDGFINSICTKCSDQGVLIDYRKLYDKVTDYDSLEIEDKIPDAVKNIVDIEEEDILLYVDKYGVNMKSGEMAEKTRCYIKI